MGTSVWASPDASTWTQVDTVKVLEQMNSVVWTGSRLVAAGWKGGILLSDAGREWRQVRKGSAIDLTCFARSPAKYVAMGWRDTIPTSDDGVKWTLRYNSTSLNKGMSSMAWNGQVYMAVGGAVMRSRDGIHWDGPYGTDYHEDQYSIIWSGREFIAVGGSGIILHSGDGLEWKAWPSGAGETLREVILSGNRLLAVGGYGTIISMPYEVPAPIGRHRLRPGSARSSSRIFSGSGFLFRRLFKDDRGTGYTPTGQRIPWRNPEKYASP